MALDMPQLRGRTPAEFVMGSTPDISHLCQFDWYQLVYYRDHDGETKIGRWIGPTTNIGAALTYWILPASCRPIARSTVFPIPSDDMLKPDVKEKIKLHSIAVQTKIGDTTRDSDMDINLQQDLTQPELDIFDDMIDDEFEPFEPESAMPDTDEFDDSLDQYINVEVLLPRDGKHVLAKVLKRKRDSHGNPLGHRHSNPLLDTRDKKRKIYF